MEEENNVFIPLVTIRLVKEKALPYGKSSVCNSEQVVKLANQIVEGADREYVMVLSVDSKSCPVAIEVISIGTLTEALVSGREVYKHCIQCGAAGIIVIHNHPSGNPTPSKEDYLMTEKLNKVAMLLGIEFLDHIIVGDEGRYYSMSENGDIRCEIGA